MEVPECCEQSGYHVFGHRFGVYAFAACPDPVVVQIFSEYFDAGVRELHPSHP